MLTLNVFVSWFLNGSRKFSEYLFSKKIEACSPTGSLNLSECLSEASSLPAPQIIPGSFQNARFKCTGLIANSYQEAFKASSGQAIYIERVGDEKHDMSISMQYQEFEAVKRLISHIPEVNHFSLVYLTLIRKVSLGPLGFSPSLGASLCLDCEGIAPKPRSPTQSEQVYVKLERFTLNVKLSKPRRIVIGHRLLEIIGLGSEVLAEGIWAST